MKTFTTQVEQDKIAVAVERAIQHGAYQITIEDDRGASGYFIVTASGDDGFVPRNKPPQYHRLTWNAQ